MNPQSSNSVDNRSQVLEEVFKKHPDMKAFFDALAVAEAQFEISLKCAEGLTKGDWVAHACNSLLEFGRAVEKAKKQLGLGDVDEPSFEQKVLSRLDSLKPRVMSLGEERAIRVAAVYQSGFRPCFVGTKDTPMEAALQVAAYMEGLSLETGPETIRKSIQRFRKSVAGEEYLRFDRQTLEWDVYKAEDVLLKGLPNRPGRPRALR